MSDWIPEKLYSGVTLEAWNSTGFEGTTRKIVISAAGDRIL